MLIQFSFIGQPLSSSSFVQFISSTLFWSSLVDIR